MAPSQHSSIETADVQEQSSTRYTKGVQFDEESSCAGLTRNPFDDNRMRSFLLMRIHESTPREYTTAKAGGRVDGDDRRRL